ncbi:MAG: hypothetical protein AAF909_12605, partial [Pseudomonadota bacterium]
ARLDDAHEHFHLRKSIHDAVIGAICATINSKIQQLWRRAFGAGPTLAGRPQRAAASALFGARNCLSGGACA